MRGYFHTRIALAVIPYWSIVIPLTLLSAYLLLVKPRSKTNQPGDEASIQPSH